MTLNSQYLLLNLQQLIASPSSTNKFLIAYSGGVDSHVLLHLCAILNNTSSDYRQSFSAVYINHGLSPNAKQWGIHAQQNCTDLEIPFTLIEVDGKAKKGQSPEAAARIARYNALKPLVEKNTYLLTAQHQDDQAETLLLQLLRGSGVKGLSAMPRIKPFGKGFLCRPLLDYTKQTLLSYAQAHQLSWIEDESNEQQCFDRNYLRHTIFPLLETHWPRVRENFAKSADILAESQSILDKSAFLEIQRLFPINKQGKVEHDKLLLKVTLGLLNQNKHCLPHDSHPLASLNNVLRYWIALNGFALPSKKVLEQIVNNVLLAQEDAMPLVKWGYDRSYCELRRYQETLYLLKSPTIVNKQQEYELFNNNQPIELDSYRSVQCLSSVQCLPSKDAPHQQGYEQKILFSKSVTIRFRQGGERFRRNTQQSSHKLKHWFQEQGIPPWERDQIPLVFWGEDLIQVGNTCVHHLSIEKKKKKDSVIIFWQKYKNK